MSIYIDAEKILPYISRLLGGMPYAILKMAETDSIDLVRCKECIYREKYPCNEIEFYECGHLRLHNTKVGVTDDWFCADEKRKE